MADAMTDEQRALVEQIVIGDWQLDDDDFAAVKALFAAHDALTAEVAARDEAFVRERAARLEAEAEVEALRREREGADEAFGVVVQEKQDALAALKSVRASLDTARSLYQQAEAKVARLVAALERARRAVDDAARIRVAGSTEMGQYARLMDTMAILDAALSAAKEA